MIKVKVDESTIPIMWLDSSVIINMAKWKKGEQIHQTERDRVAKLYRKIYDLVRLAKLICPDAYQREEFEMGDRLINECWEVQSLLSLGIETLYRKNIEDWQTQRAMISYIEGKPEIHLSYRDIFSRDPMEEINRRGLYFTAVYITPDGWKKKWRTVKTNVADNLEEIRQAVVSDNMSFEERLDVEYSGLLQGILMLGDRYLSKVQNGEKPTIEDFLGSLSLGEPLALWDRFDGKPEGLTGLVSFYQSDFFKRIPYVEIKCKLYAKMMTSNTKIQSGDSMDVNQLSVMIPYCDLIITDRKMKNRITELGLDQQFRTKVFSMRDFSDIMLYLDGL